MVTKRKFSWKFKLKAVKLVTQRGVSVPQAAKFDNQSTSRHRHQRLYRAVMADSGRSGMQTEDTWPTYQRHSAYPK
jgi:transposase-like protein